MSTSSTYFTTRSLLPWDDTREDRLRLWIPVILFVIISLLLIIAIQLAPPVQQERYQPEKVPERLAKFIMEQKANPPKPVTPPKVKEPEKPKEKPTEKTAETKAAPPKEAPKVKPTEQ